MKRSSLLILAVVATMAHAQAVVTPFSAGVPGATPPLGWAPQTFPRIPRHTRYEFIVDEGRIVAAAAADASASGLIHRLDVPAANARILRWTWKGLRLPEGGDIRQRGADDAVARVYVAFRTPPERQTWLERLIVETLRAIYGEAPPDASLMYVWDAKAPLGTRLANPYTNRVHTVVVESGDARVGEWLAYRRDLVADYRAAFGSDPPPIAGVAIMTDTDHTGTRAAARYGDVMLSKD
jgi:hypothetical protein